MTQPPVAPRRPVVRSHHGDDVVDDYEWLRDIEDPEVLAHLEAENEHTADRTVHLADLRQTIFDEIKARTQETDLSVPVRHGAWWYYTRTVEGQQYGIRARCPIADPADWTPPVLDAGTTIPDEEVLLDSNVEAEGHEFFSLGAFSLSDDDRYLAWSVDVTGDERYTIRVKDLHTGEVLPDEIVGAAAGATWSAGATHLFYSTVDDAWRPHQVWRHRLGDTGDDTLVHEEPDERYFTGVGRTQSEKYLVIGSSSKITSEARLLPADDPEGEFRVVMPRRDGVEYSVEHAVVGDADVLLVLHNDGAADFELVSVPMALALAGELTRAAQGTVVVGADPSLRLEDVDVFARHLFVSYRRAAMTRIGVLAITDEGFGPLREVEFAEELFSCGVGGNAEWDQPLVRIGFGSFVTPSTVYDLDPDTFETVLLKQATVLGDYDPADYVQHRTWATAPDGTQVPVSVVARADTPRDGTAPGLLYGYGAYEISIDPAMSAMRLSLLDRGFVFAVAHVRGGGEMGRAWYDDGKLGHKRNTFTDFVAAARHLVDEGWTAADRLVAEGGSAGGLLMGAVANLAPEAFCGILANVPFVDALTTILDPSLPLTVIEWDEWGNPLADPEVYAYMKSYTPYENIRATAYPSILAVTSLHDTRVHVVEPTKWVARLRETATGSAPVLLKTEMHAGHGGVSGRYASWHERAFELAWIIDTAGAA
ncbi:peptidase, S9A/B/C family, catalytic domain protein [Aeromicrobium marinum DSM 15272]|uniref:Peptidase, S9A/B/C family, catalytic domain protein n=1 Tax=Aeromicrobium marinum DSM 15272 TaxID=585531 RepID=E2SAD3_9ACTN|nr:S9 family peptidase [Aeromicrobium marinum]EFQ84207.1 peptidase, S9A/B/C family, catalytic domain protein [Aeromicrobium marinum DSM 15272]